MKELDSAVRFEDLRATIQRKGSLRSFYESAYRFFQVCVKAGPQGKVLELGSGGGFLKQFIPQAITSDFIPYAGIDQVIDARVLPFENESLSMICMLDVFHHIPDVEIFLNEANRALMPGGCLAIVDQHKGWISKPILKYAHHEPYDEQAPQWNFKASGPLSDANGALAWIVFDRDLKIFREKFPRLRLVRYEPWAPLQYWLSGGLKTWNLVPNPLVKPMKVLDEILAKIHKDFGSFVRIEVRKI